MFLFKEFKYQDLDYRVVNDDRAIFVNAIFKEVAKNVENTTELLKYIKNDKTIYNGIFEYVRNVYELTSNQIPLLMLYNGRSSDFGYTGMDFEEYEVHSVDKFVYDVCEHFYF